MDLAPGVVVAERYFVDRKIGTGGMAEVWGGQHLVIGCRVALKRLLPAKALRHDMVTRFKREAFFLGRVESDYVARVLDFVTDPALGLVLVMEFVDGEPLSNVLRRRKLTVEEALELGADLASALVDLHKASIVHRDLKPANVILRPLPEGRTRAVVVDFGVSRLLPDGNKPQAPGGEDTMTRLTRSNVALGTIEYMAPEQVLNSRDATERSDLYAIGAILYRAVAGRHVFGRLQGGHLARTKISVPAPRLETGRTDKLAVALGEVVDKALKRRPAERHPSAQALLDDLGPLREIARLASLDVETTFGGEQTRRMSVRELLGEALAAEHVDGHDEALALDDVDHVDDEALEGRVSEPMAIDEADLEPAPEGELAPELDVAPPETRPQAEDSVSTDPQPPDAVERARALPVATPTPLSRNVVGLIDDDSADEPTARHDASTPAAPASSGPPPLPGAETSPPPPAALAEASPAAPAAAAAPARPAFESRPALDVQPDVAATAPPIATPAEPTRRPPTLAVIFMAATLLGVLIALLVIPARPPTPAASASGAATAETAAARADDEPGASSAVPTPADVDTASLAPSASAIASASPPSSSAASGSSAVPSATASPSAVAALTASAPKPKLTGRLSDLAPPPSAAPSGEPQPASSGGASAPVTARPAAAPRPDPDVYE